VALKVFWGWQMVSEIHICATWHLTKKNGQELSPVWGLAGFLLPCKKDPSTSRHNALSSKGSSPCRFPYRPYGRVLPTWQTTCPDLYWTIERRALMPPPTSYTYLRDRIEQLKIEAQALNQNICQAKYY